MPPRREDPISQQSFENGEIHDWYRFVWGYSDHLVAGLLEEWGLKPGSRVLDPFCGTGTTLVECMKHRLTSTGVDASPASIFASRVKTHWRLNADRMFWGIREVVRVERRVSRQIGTYEEDPTFRYLQDSGMIDRGWISARPLARALAIKRAISNVDLSRPYKELLTLALLDAVVQDGSNIRFGPELYVDRRRRDAPVLDAFVSRALIMACDLAETPGSIGRATVLRGDSREVGAVLRKARQSRFDAVICSPPYPAEHDYTRNARLELAFLEAVSDVQSLRLIKKSMIRSHTKGIYTSDRDWLLTWGHKDVSRIARLIEDEVVDSEDGFARLYSTVVASYFGGMLRHFKSVRGMLKKGARCAYVVSEQASFAGVHIPTARILADVAKEAGFSVDEIRHWRTRKASTSAQAIDEEILLLTNPLRRKRRRSRRPLPRQ